MIDTLAQKYNLIQNAFNDQSDFNEVALNESQKLFSISKNTFTPKKFEVWTSLAGLPINQELEKNLSDLFDTVKTILPNINMYKVKPENYHWELFIIKRPDENLAQTQLEEAKNNLNKILGNHTYFDINYKGFLITPDGTIIAKGFGDFDNLRAKLKLAIPFASQKQSNLGHISLGRILDKVGVDAYKNLKKLITDSENTKYGSLKVNEIKYVHESQWYMEEKIVLQTTRLNP